ncbi:LLM class flavin-dependent oxidoreductase [Flindersiella endophytica]
MNNDVDFGVLLPAREAALGGGWRTRDLIDVARLAERLGFASVWSGDSIARSRVAPLPLLGAVAAVTERVRLGTAALVPAYHHPVPMAQALSSLDLLSDGRLVVGVGAGFPGRSEREFDLVGVPFARRNARLDDIVALWRQLWTDPDATTFHGKVLHYEDLLGVTPPAQPQGPPIWLAADTPRARERAGRLYDGWLPYPPDPADYATGLADVRQAASERSVTPGLYLTALLTPSVEEGRAALSTYCQAYYGAPLEYVETVQALVAGPAEHIAAQVTRYATAGARHVILRVGSLDRRIQLAQLEALAGLLANA